MPGKKLIVVESPTKARTLTKYLGRGYVVKASVGHVKDLPKSKLGVDVTNSFKPQYETIPRKHKVLEEIRKASRTADEIFLGPDPDREGEAIAWQIAEEIGETSVPVRRVLFHEITKRGVTRALENPVALNRDLYEAQQARRVLDRLVGYRISPVLWKKVRRGLSAGRVQSVALRIICEREKAIVAFRPVEYWSMTALLEAHEPPAFEAKLVRRDGEKIEVRNGEEAEAIRAGLERAQYRVARIERKERRRNPAAPFITSRLQQEAARKLRMSAKRTMALAQQLYEGVDLGPEGTVGLITYMRTDSPRVAPEALAEVRDWIRSHFDETYLPKSPNVFGAAKQAQEAHEAIRPASVGLEPEAVKRYLTDDQWALYDLIWKRFVASQMEPAVYDQTGVDVSAGPYTLRASGSVLKFDGFMRIYIEGTEGNGSVAAAGSEEDEDKEGRIPPLTEGEELKLGSLLPRQHFTEPPPRFTESSLIRELETNGIGRPSTYATILSTIQERDYAVKEQGRFAPTELGKLVSDLLTESFPQIMNVEFTAGMEGDLDKVEEGSLGWTKLLSDFYGPFEIAIAEADKKMRDVKRQVIPSDEKCPVCDAPMVVRWGRRGEFLSCSRYPECKGTKDIARPGQADGNGGAGAAGDGAASGEAATPCEACGKPMVQRSGRFGPFLACSGYPVCKNTKKIGRDAMAQAEDLGPAEGVVCPVCSETLHLRRTRAGTRSHLCAKPGCKGRLPYPTGFACPREGCGGAIVEKESRRGKPFFGCHRYPACDYSLWKRPVKKCPQCATGLIGEKPRKGKTAILKCQNAECGYEEEPAPELPEARGLKP